jgi:hypothetical protein
MDAFTPDAWHDFFVAQVGATAALTGLVIVAISINIATIINNRLLSGRAAETVVLLAGVLLLSTMALVPGQPLWLFGVECLAVALGMSGMAAFILFRARSLYHPDEQRWLRIAITLGASLPAAAGGVSLLLGQGGGIYWLVPAILVALLGGITNSWILLVEILR